MLQYVEVCVRAGYLERANKLLHRMEILFGPGSREAMMGQNVLLRESITTAMRTSDESAYRDAQRHFETRMSAQGMYVDARSLAALVDGCLHLLDGEQRVRTIRRYLEYAESHELDVFDKDYYGDEQYTLLQEIANSGFRSPSTPNSAEIEESIKREEIDPNRAPKDFIPEVRPVQLKGLGLRALKNSLEQMSTDFVPDESLAQSLQEAGEVNAATNSAKARQIMLERGTINAALERWRVENDTMRKMGISTALHTKAIASLMWEWHSQLVPALKAELDKVRDSLARERAKPGDARLSYGPFLLSVEPEKLSALTIAHVLSMLGIQGAAGGLRLAGATKALGTQVEVESDLQALGGARKLLQLKKIPGKHRAQIQRRLNTARFQPQGHHTGKSILKRPAIQADSSSGEVTVQELNWSASIRVKIGAVLISKLMDSAKILVSKQHPQTKEMLTQLQPAFYHTYHYQQGKRIGRLAANFALVEKLSSEPPSGVLAKRLPMIVEPRPWTGYAEGGYYLEPTPIIRHKTSDSIQRSYAIAATERGDMDQVFAGLNVLGKTAWRINQEVLKVQIQAWDTGEAIADFAPENPVVQYPPEPPEDANRFVHHEHRRVREKLGNEKMGFHSQRCFQNFQLEIARAYRDETLYFPHNVDFRGRAYPIPPYLNHMGADNCRGLLVFAKGKELGEHGLRWLKIHLANVFGYDKASLDEREAFTMDHLADIRDAVTKPFDGKRWWLSSEDRWQVLAACFELTRALDSPDPTKYVSHLPIHQDGTCNGLQHYAALGGDTFGAAQVNLEPGNRPADIYTAVSELVKAQCAKDAEEGNENAKTVNGKITRKVVKQTVMTNVYGVTFVGAREQVQRQLEDILPEWKKTYHLRHCASYLAVNIFKALSTMFEGAHAIQNWFGQCADRISRCATAEQVKRFREHNGNPRTTQEKYEKGMRKQSRLAVANILGCKSTVIWTTPLRMPVVQPYRAAKTVGVTTTLQHISITEPRPWDPVSRRKQMGGFPPNFIHSLDATHMILSALKCDELGLTFGSVHDSFWTHAGDIPTLNRVLRDAFVRMHSEDIIGRLAAEFQARYKGCWYLAGFYCRSELGTRILAWRKRTFGKKSDTADSRAQELLMEQDRLSALQSEDEETRKHAETIDTPASIYAFAAEADKDAFAVKPQTSELGKVDETVDRLGMSPLDDDVVDESRVQHHPESDQTPEEKLAGVIESEADSDEPDVPLPEQLTTLIRKKKQKQAEKKTFVWLPLVFPEVPKKGDFDVSRLKDSQYFFS